MSESLLSRTRSLMWKSLLLLGSGAVTSLFLSLISSPTISFNKEHLKFLFLTLQWYNFSLTFVKGGLENEIFALTLSGRKALFSKAIIYGLIPSILICFLASLIIQNNPVNSSSNLLFLALFFDSISMYYIAQLSAIGHYSTVAISNVLNYPFFIILLIVFAKNVDNLARFNFFVSIFFVLASFARLSYLVWQKSALLNINFNSVTQVTPKISLVISQCLNYILFKADVILIALFSGLEKYNFPLTDRFVYYIFLSQFIDIWTGIVTSLSPILNKKYVPQNRLFSLQSISGKKAIVYLATILIVFLAYALVFYQKKIVLLPFDLIFLMVIRAALGLPVNLMSYSMISLNLSASLVKNLSISILIGLCFYFVCVFYLFQSNVNFLPYCIAAIVPMQLFLVLVLKKPD
jgi:hypothetical protein